MICGDSDLLKWFVLHFNVCCPFKRHVDAMIVPSKFMIVFGQKKNSHWNCLAHTVVVALTIISSRKISVNERHALAYYLRHI